MSKTALALAVLAVAASSVAWSQSAPAEPASVEPTCRFFKNWATQAGSDDVAAFIKQQKSAGATTFTPFGQGTMCAH